MRNIWVAAISLVIACAAIGAQADDSLRVIPFGRYVVKTNSFWELSDSVESIEPGGIEYGSELRHPYIPLGAVVVDCQLTDRLGVALVIGALPDREKPSTLGDRYTNMWSKEVKAEIIWRHSDDDRLRRSSFVTPVGLRESYVFNNGITLNRKRRVDGTWTVAVILDGKTVYRTSFELVRCPKKESLESIKVTK